MIGSLPGSGGNANGDLSNEKRKSPDENDASEEGDAKRQETQDGEKGAKKPGRKPLTSEPTTVCLLYQMTCSTQTNMMCEETQSAEPSSTASIP